MRKDEIQRFLDEFQEQLQDIVEEHQRTYGSIMADAIWLERADIEQFNSAVQFFIFEEEHHE